MTDSPARAAAIGLDIGGTSTRAVVLDTEGRRLGYGRSGGGNLSSHDRGAALDAIQDAIGTALATTDPGRVRYGVIGTAGTGHLARPDVAAEFDARWRATGLTTDYQVVSDAVVAFCAGTDRPHGTLILSGTGALAAAVSDRTVTTMLDGHGWLLGDLGSAFWLGREAVRHTLRTFDRHRDPTPLARAVLHHYDIAMPAEPGPREVQSALHAAVYRAAPVTLARLAPLVTGHVDEDPAAAGIVDVAAGHLADAATELREPDDTSPIVLAGSLLSTDTPLATVLRRRATDRWPDAPIGAATDGAAAAAWLALIRGGLVARDDAAGVHRAALGG